jgi:pimeloyl-ACP methyl ester carboxylesterase
VATTAATQVLVHGLGLSSAIWGPLTVSAGAVPILAPDLPGCGPGAATNAGAGGDFAAIWDWLRTLINDRPCHLVLHSMAAGLLPEVAAGSWRPASIVLVEGNLLAQDAAFSRQIAALADDAYATWLDRFRRNAALILRGQLRQPQAPPDIARWSAGFREVDAGSLQRLARALVQRTDSGAIAAALPRLGVPVTWLRGGQSEPWDEGRRQLAALDVPVVDIPGCGHYPMLDAPDACWQAIRAATDPTSP